MARIVQPQGTKGSLKWIQRLVNERPELLNGQLTRTLSLSKEDGICWLSPLTTDEYAEYRDSAFLERLDISLDRRSLRSFWPNRGPQWDGLGRTDSGKVVLVEAKAHVGELVSAGTKASEKSRERIIASLDEAKEFLRVRSGIDWCGTFYQYANRLAHLYLLRTLNNIDAYMVFLYFLGDEEMDGPQGIGEWQTAIKVLEAALGLRRHRLSRFILDVFVDVTELK